MIEKDAYTTVCDLLKPECFYEPRHVLIYEAIQTLGFEQKHNGVDLGYIFFHIALR